MKRRRSTTRSKKGKKMHEYTIYLEGYPKPFIVKAFNPDDALEKIAKKLNTTWSNVWKLYVRGYEDGKFL